MKRRIRFKEELAAIEAENKALGDEVETLRTKINSMRTASSLSPDEAKGWTEYGKQIILNQLKLPIEKVCAAYPTKMANLHWAIAELREAFNEANS